MPIPLATASLTILRAPATADYAEPYSGTTTADLDEVETGVRAVIYAPTGQELLAGGEQTVTQLRFVCDLADLKNKDLIRDDLTDVTYRVLWRVTYAGEHIEGGLEVVEGLV